MPRFYIVIDVPDFAGDKFDVAWILAGKHSLLHDPTVYDSLADLVADDREREDACARCRKDADELYGDEALCSGCFGPDSPVSI